MKEIVIDYDSVKNEPLLYRVSRDEEGDVGFAVPALIDDAPALVTSADIVEVRSLDGLYRLSDRTGFLYSTRNFCFPTPEGGDKCTNVYGITGALRDLYIRRCISVEMRRRSPVKYYCDEESFYGKYIFYDNDEFPLSGDDTESLIAGLAAVLPEPVLVCFIDLNGGRSKLMVDLLAEKECILRLYMPEKKKEKKRTYIAGDNLREMAKSSIGCCLRANLRTLADREDYHNDRVKELIRKYTESKDNG